MKVLMVSNDFPPHPFGGVGRHTGDLSNALREIGIKVRNLTVDRIDGERTEEPDVVRVFVDDFVPSKSTLGGKHSPLTLLHHNVVLGAHWALQSDNEFDIVHAQDVFAIPVAVSLARMCGTPLILSKHFISTDIDDASYARPSKHGVPREVVDYHHRFMVDLELWGIREADRVIAVSRDVTQWVNTAAAIDPSKCTTIYNGTNIHSYGTPLTLEDVRIRCGVQSRYMALVVGRLTAAKGGDVAIRAIARLRNLDISLVFVGEGSYQGHLSQLATQLEIEDRVKFPGFIDVPELASVYESADLVLVPTLADAFNLTVLEGKAMGRPVIASDIPSIAEQIENGNTGFLFPAKDDSRLARTIIDVLGDPQSAAKMGDRARADAVSRGSWWSIAQQTLDVYQDAYSRKSDQ